MTNGRFIRKLLHLVGLRVCDLWFKHRRREFHLHVKPHKNGAQCPQQPPHSSGLGTEGRVQSVLGFLDQPASSQMSQVLWITHIARTTARSAK
jgi:hypothetical protein